MLGSEEHNQCGCMHFILFYSILLILLLESLLTWYIKATGAPSLLQTPTIFMVPFPDLLLGGWVVSWWTGGGLVVISICSKCLYVSLNTIDWKYQYYLSVNVWIVWTTCHLPYLPIPAQTCLISFWSVILSYKLV